MSDNTLPFNGLFHTDSRHAARTFDRGFRWDFDEKDLNESARALFRHVDRVFDILREPDHVFLSSIVWTPRRGASRKLWFSTSAMRHGLTRSPTSWRRSSELAEAASTRWAA